MRAIIILIFGAAVVSLAVACGGDDAGETGGRTIVAAFYPLAYAAERIAPDASVRNLTPPGAEPHDLELSARDAEALDDADLVLYLGGGFMPALEDAVAGRPSAVDLLTGQDLLERSGEDELPFDPHVWLDPLRYAELARSIAAALGEPGAAGELVAELEQLDAELRAGLADCERRQIVTSHAAFGYLARAYDLEQIALTGLSPEAEPAPRALARLVEEVKATGATTIFFESLVSPRLAETVARETGTATAELSPLEGLTGDELAEGADYFSVMRDNLNALRAALGCR